MYDEVADAKQACDKLNGYNFMGRYLVVLYHQLEKMKMVEAGGSGGAVRGEESLEERRERLEKVKKEHGID